MNEITRIALENEMDLILAHRQSMKMIELTGQSLSAQTTFATAVSEIARIAIEHGKNSCLILSLSDKKDKQKKVTATIKDDKVSFVSYKNEGYKYAKRLVDNIELLQREGETEVELHYNIPNAFRIDDALLEKWLISFNNDPEVSPYEEIKRKNRQLVEMSDRLRESEGQYRTLTNSLPLMIFTLGKDGKVTYANEWLQQYTGQTVEILNNTNWKEVLHPEDMNDVWEGWREKTSNYDPITIERRLKDCRSGEYRWYTGIVTPILHENGDLLYWTAYLADIHAQKTVEQTLKDNKELKDIQQKLEDNISELNRSNRELEQFAYIASHDLQEPLRKISFYSDFLQKNFKHALADEGAQFLDNIINSTDRMKGLIQDILAYSTINKDRELFETVDLNKVTAAAIHDLEVAMTEKNAKILMPRLPAIEGNESQMKQLFENLLSNSIKYSSPDRQPEIEIQAKINDQEIVLYFIDNGIGFEEKYLERMFGLFQRLHGREKYMGTGIGLAICKKIVEIHNGSITAVSKLGQGATFIITLPIVHLNKNQELRA